MQPCQLRCIWHLSENISISKYIKYILYKWYYTYLDILHVLLYIYIYIYTHTYIYLYIHIYRQIDRWIERGVRYDDMRESVEHSVNWEG